jgi:hypothetical protein
MRTLLRAVSLLALVLLTHTTARAQATAQLTGTVRDESGAVLPGVTVTVTQTDTGFTRTVVTEGSGAYIIPNLRLEAFNVLNHVNWATQTRTTTRATSGASRPSAATCASSSSE